MVERQAPARSKLSSGEPHDRRPHSISPHPTWWMPPISGEAAVSVVIPLYNYAHYIQEALELVRMQTLPLLDLVVVDDGSTDASLQVTVDWATRHASRFNRIVVLRNRENAGLGRTRNAGFDAAETQFVLPLDADNRLLPDCCASLLRALDGSRSGFAYPRIRSFGDSNKMFGDEPFSAMRFAGGNYIDAMALVGKWAWAAVGGYEHIPHGWEDYDFWCRFLLRTVSGGFRLRRPGGIPGPQPIDAGNINRSAREQAEADPGFEPSP